MLEQLGERIERLELERLHVGDAVHVTTGIGDEAFHYEMSIQTAGRWPTVLFKEIRPDGSEVGPFPAEIHGSGRWTTRRQNPVQDQDRAFTSYWDSLSIGCFMAIKNPNDPMGQRLVFDKPGQEITNISIKKA
jgi:hypothetical protein